MLTTEVGWHLVLWHLDVQDEEPARSLRCWHHPPAARRLAAARERVC